MDALDTLNLLRRMRHDFGNHLQIISGYIDLGNPVAVQDYIAKVTLDMKQDGLILALGNAQVSLHLLKQVLLVQDLGVILKYIELDIKSGQRLIRNNEPFNIINSLLNENKVYGEITIELFIHETLTDTIIKVKAPQLFENVLTFYLKE